MPIPGEIFHYREIAGLYRETPGYVGRVGRSAQTAELSSFRYETIGMKHNLCLKNSGTDFEFENG